MRLLIVALLVAETNRISDLEQIARSGRCVSSVEKPDFRIAPLDKIAPGPPPLLSFRLYEGKQHGRFGNSDLMLDDAGH